MQMIVVPGNSLGSPTGNRKLDIIIGLLGAFLWIMKVISTSRQKD